MAAVDIVAAARDPVNRANSASVAISALWELCRQHSFVDLLLYPPPTGKDGFLATNSLLGFAPPYLRAYATEFGSDTDWQDTVNCLEPLLPNTSAALEEWDRHRSGLERPLSSFTARPHPIASRSSRRPRSSSTRRQLRSRSTSLARQAERGRARLHLRRGPRGRTARSAPDRRKSRRRSECRSADFLARGTEDHGWAGVSRDIDPGRPGVPKFGRKLYHLPLPRPQRVPGLPRLTPREAAAITRKAGVGLGHLAASGELGRWREALLVFTITVRRSHRLMTTTLRIDRKPLHGAQIAQ